MRRSVLFIAACATVAGNAHATQCSGERIDWARTSAQGNILVNTTFGLMLSKDHGKTWNMVKTEERISSPVEAGPAFVTALKDEVRPSARGLYRSPDFGRTWNRIGNANGAGFAAGPAGTVVACDAAGAQVEKYTPSTQRWSKTGPLTNGENDSGTCRQVWADGSDLWVRGERRMFRSKNNGDSWTAMVLPQYHGKPLQSPMHADAAGALYASAGVGDEQYLIRSKNGGATWARSRPRYSGSMAPQSERLLLAQGRALYVLGSHRKPFSLEVLNTVYRVTGGKAEKLLDIPTLLLMTPQEPLHVAADGSMSYVNQTSVWVSLAGGKNWREIPGHALANKRWLSCGGANPPVQ